ncbi:MAG TPA: CPBP family intramembrane glutamic endopeptidase [Candidatus Acidoferrales bacterium]|nr:CPBP family intramembrane glutamic endopeptidase [Candidatus Acidoferrales bacterium]
MILLFLGVVVPWLGAMRIKELLARPKLDRADRLTLYASTIAFQWLAVGVVAWRANARGLNAEHLGLALPEPELTAATAAALSLLLLITQLYSLRRLAHLPPERQGFLHHMARKVMPQSLVETLVFIALVCTVAPCEEFLYRGFSFAAIEDASRGSLLLAALSSAALFSLAHLYQGRQGLVSTFVVGLLFAGARTLTASLGPSIIAHLVADLIAGLAAPRLLAGRASPEAVDRAGPLAPPEPGKDS